MSRNKGFGYFAGFDLTYVKAEETGVAMRRVLAPGLALTQPVSMERILDRLDDFTVEAGGEQVPLFFGASDDLESEGVTEFREGRIFVRLRTDVYRGVRRNEGRALFTAAHELAHAFVHSTIVRQLSAVPHEQAVLARSARWHHVCADTEWQANAIGAAFLAPAAGIAALFENPSTAELQRRFHLTFSAASLRLRSYVTYPELRQVGGGL